MTANDVFTDGRSVIEAAGSGDMEAKEIEGRERERAARWWFVFPKMPNAWRGRGGRREEREERGERR